MDDFAPDHAPNGPATLIVDLGAFEGPLDLLLSLARTQKVDLREISVLRLSEQYLAFIASARALHLDVAADYLVMAAWLAYLKSRLLLPEPESEGELSGEELAAHLAFQLERLEAMRRAGAELMARARLGREVFARGAPETASLTRHRRVDASLHDLIRAYARLRTRDAFQPWAFDRSDVLAYEAALERLRGGVAADMGWARLETFLPEGWTRPAARRSATASLFAASLELARTGAVELRQQGAFAPLELRARGAP